MTIATTTFPPEHQLVKLLILVVGLLTMHGMIFADPEVPQKDALRYADYIYNLSQFNSFGLSFGAIDKPAKPGASNAPLYPWLASLVTTDNTRTSLACRLANSERKDCSLNQSVCGPEIDPTVTCENHLLAIIFLNYVLVAISLLMIGVTAFRLFPEAIYLYGTPIFAFLAFELTDYAQQILVTNLVVPLFLMLQYQLLVYLDNRDLKSAASLGLVTGLLALTRPEYLLLIPALLFILILIRDVKLFRHLLILSFFFVLVISPWLIRNNLKLSVPTLVKSEYGQYVFSERLAYNEMTWQQWSTSFVYWAPDIGDKLAERYLPETARVFSRHNPEALIHRSSAILKAADPNASIASFFISGVLDQPIKHIAVSFAFAWRGLFIGKLWAVPAIVGFVLLLRREIRLGRYELLWITLIPLYMLLLRSGVSINVTRYNMPMIGLFSMGYVFLLQLARQK